MNKVKILGLLLIAGLLITGCGSDDKESKKDKNENIGGITYYKDVKIVYFNPESGKICDDWVDENSQKINTHGCLKWYAYSENEDKTVNMILDHDITDEIAWSNDETNYAGPSMELLDLLKNTTAHWIGVKDRTDDYRVDNSYSKYIIDYTGYKARMISAEEIANIIGYDGDLYNVNVEDLNVTPWLFDRVSVSCEKYGCLNNKKFVNENYTTNYWTSSPFVNTEDGKTPVNTGAYYVNYMGKLRFSPINDKGTALRPVISIDKELIK